jgi:deoxyribonuclease-2
VLTVSYVKLDEGVEWKDTQDHSKWVVADTTNYACFGDLNREKSQWTRGGAYYCLDHK